MSNPALRSSGANIAPVSTACSRLCLALIASAFALGAVLAQPSRKRARVHAAETRDVLFDQPLMQRTARRVMTVRVNIVLHDERLNLNTVRFIGTS